METYRGYIYLVLFFKIIFSMLLLVQIYLNFKQTKDTEFDKKIKYWKHRVEFIFIFLMSCLLIYLFNPRTDRTVMIDYETKILLYIFGFVLILSADWKHFFEDNKWITKIFNK